MVPAVAVPMDAPTYEEVLAALEAASFPISTRNNVREVGDTAPIQGMCLGVTTQWSYGPVLSRATRERLRLSRLLCAFARSQLPGFTFTSVQVNKDYRAALHVDANNQGPSWIIGLGDYTGGELWLHTGGKFGQCVDIQGRWFSFDGTDPHCVMPFRGRRYTLVYFTHRHPTPGADLTEEMRHELSILGFPLPDRIEWRARAPKDAALASARVALGHFCCQAVKRGGPLRSCVRVRCPDGCVLRVAMSPTAPLQHLADAVADRLHTLAGPGTALGRRSAVRLSLDEFKLLPTDSVAALSLREWEVIDVHVLQPSESADTAPRSGPKLPPVDIGLAAQQQPRPSVRPRDPALNGHDLRARKRTRLVDHHTGHGVSPKPCLRPTLQMRRADEVGHSATTPHLDMSSAVPLVGPLLAAAERFAALPCSRAWAAALKRSG